jgi:hypothetical protein
MDFMIEIMAAETVSNLDFFNNWGPDLNRIWNCFMFQCQNQKGSLKSELCNGIPTIKGIE